MNHETNPVPVWAIGWQARLVGGPLNGATYFITGELPRYVRNKLAKTGVFDRMPPAVHCFDHFLEAVPWTREPDDEFWIEDFWATPDFPLFLNVLDAKADPTVWRAHFLEQARWFQAAAVQQGISSGRSRHDGGRDERNSRVGRLWETALKQGDVHRTIAAYLLAALYDFLGAWACGLHGWQAPRSERERRWTVHFGLGPRGTWTRWEDPSAEEKWPAQTDMAASWLNFKMAMRMTKHSSMRTRHSGLFRDTERPLWERRSLSALYYYFENMRIESAGQNRWNIEYKGQRYQECQLDEPAIWETARRCALGRDYAGFLNWYDTRKAALAGIRLTLTVAGNSRTEWLFCSGPGVP